MPPAGILAGVTRSVPQAPGITPADDEARIGRLGAQDVGPLWTLRLLSPSRWRQADTLMPALSPRECLGGRREVRLAFRLDGAEAARHPLGTGREQGMPQPPLHRRAPVGPARMPQENAIPRTRGSRITWATVRGRSRPLLSSRC